MGIASQVQVLAAYAVLAPTITATMAFRYDDPVRFPPL
jgi:hypothetical protein